MPFGCRNGHVAAAKDGALTEDILAKNILIIDDEPTTTRLVKNYLEINGFAVQEAHDGEQGLRLLKQLKADLIVLDIQMPVMNGYTFMLELKKLGKEYKNIPVMILTSKEGMADIFKIEGAKEYVVKPFKPEELLTAIRKYI